MTTTVTPTRLCPTCAAHGRRVLMVNVGKAWICPVQRLEARIVSAQRRSAVRAAADAIDPSLGF